jgi:hypothetical protein
MILIGRGLKYIILFQSSGVLSGFSAYEIWESLGAKRPQSSIWRAAKNTAEKERLVTGKTSLGSRYGPVIRWRGRTGKKKYQFDQYLQIGKDIKNSSIRTINI